MKDILKLGVTLFAICAVAALVLGVTNNITAPVIEERNIQASNEARKTVLPEADEFKELHAYYTTRKDNPLKKLQSLIVITCKILRVIFAILTKGMTYDPKKMLRDIVRPNEQSVQVA